MYLTLGRVGNNSFCHRLSYGFALFHAFHYLFTPPKTPSFPTRPPTFLGVLRVFCHLSLTLEHKIRCFLVISLVFTVKIDAAVFWNLRIYLRFPWNLRNVIDPLTMKAAAKLSSPALKIEVSGFGWPQKIFLRAVNVIIVSCVWLVKITSLLTSLVWKDAIGVLVSSRSLGGSRNSLEI